jgi:hypothetical protein
MLEAGGIAGHGSIGINTQAPQGAMS